MHDQQRGRSLDDQQHGFNNPGSESQGQTATSLKEKAKQATHRVTEEGAEAINRAKEKGRNFADDQKSHLGERIHNYGSAVRRAADQLREEKDPNIAYYADQIADRLDQAADYVRSSDPGKMMRDVENAARRRPEIFFGGMFLAGLVLARFLKASSERDDSYMAETEENYWVEDSNHDQDDMGEVTATAPFQTTMPGEPSAEWGNPTTPRPEANKI